jgi:hypothetical protein
MALPCHQTSTFQLMSSPAGGFAGKAEAVSAASVWINNRSFGFQATSAEANGLYCGCTSTVHAVNLTLPGLIVIGVQKGGTTSLEVDLQQYTCFAPGEPHYFDKPQFERTPIGDNALRCAQPRAPASGA